MTLGAGSGVKALFIPFFFFFKYRRVLNMLSCDSLEPMGKGRLTVQGR